MLPNGLRLHLAHDPAASRAAAWLRVAAGSHDEPSAHPGLAHFLEHLSFLGGAAFPGDERLMPWLPRSTPAPGAGPPTISSR